jgi:hypothetical protein
LVLISARARSILIRSLIAVWCADAGADHSSYVNEHTGYDMVQNAANAGQFEAVVKLVEAGASWRLPKGHPRVVQGAIWYVPEILSVQKQMKVRLCAMRKFGVNWIWMCMRYMYTHRSSACSLLLQWVFAGRAMASVPWLWQVTRSGMVLTLLCRMSFYSVVLAACLLGV